jgi:hypothetical protein
MAGLEQAGLASCRSRLLRRSAEIEPKAAHPARAKLGGPELETGPKRDGARSGLNRNPDEGMTKDIIMSVQGFGRPIGILKNDRCCEGGVMGMTILTGGGQHGRCRSQLFPWTYMYALPPTVPKETDRRPLAMSA